MNGANHGAIEREDMKESIKELEKKRDELDKKIKQYYAEIERERIQQNEEKYVGKCYKVEDKGSTVYMKILSGLTNNTYCYMHCMEFKLPINPGFKPISRMHNNNKFEYRFMGDILEFDDVLIKPISYGNDVANKRIEITSDEFEDALQEFGRQLIDISREDYTLNSKYFRN